MLQGHPDELLEEFCQLIIQLGVALQDRQADIKPVVLRVLDQLSPYNRARVLKRMAELRFDFKPRSDS